KIIHLGDFTDNRKYVNTQIMSRIRETFIEPIVAREIETDFILGNHDVYLKNTNKISSPNEFLRTYPKFRIFDETTHIKIDNLDCLYIPWINSENQEKSLNTIKNSYASVVFGHLELQSFLMYPGVYCEHGLDKTLFKKFKQVWSGHFHTSSFQDNIFYCGNLWQLTFADMFGDKGFYILDTETLERTFVKNPYKMFNRIEYNDKDRNLSDVMQMDFSILKDSYVKIVVNSKTNPYYFDRFIDAIQKCEPFNYSVIDNTQLGITEDDVALETEDTITILNKSIDNLDTELDKNKLKQMIQRLYTEASGMEN